MCRRTDASTEAEMQFKKDRDTLIAEADDRGVHENLESVDMEAFAMHR